jgi:uncharacterized repeat protein (TIGR03803 family)
MSGIKTFVSRGSSPIQFEILTRALALLTVLLTLTTVSHAQSNFTVLQTFNATDGDNPESTPTLDSHGNLYGTTVDGGAGRQADGVVYELAPANGSWIMHPLYSFMQGNDGAAPYAGVTIGPDGSVFGVAAEGGAYSHGTLFQLQPPASVCHAFLCPWTETTLHSFAGGSDGAVPDGNVVFDPQGNLYGTTVFGGAYGNGTVYEATRSGSSWNVSVLYSFEDGTPISGLTLDSAGNLYGTANGGANGLGMVFELSPSGEGWTETTLYSFTGGSDGCDPTAGLVFDRAGNLYGATGALSCTPQTVFELSPQGSGWNFTTIYTSTFGHDGGCQSTLAIDSAGNLYGTQPYGGPDAAGEVFELSPSAGGWTYTDLHDFTLDHGGWYPVGGVAVTGPGGYLYGATDVSTPGYGLIYQINLGAH